MTFRQKEIIRDLCYRVNKKDMSNNNKSTVEQALLYALKRIREKREVKK